MNRRYSYIKKEELLGFIKKHPGLTFTQLKIRLNSDIHITLAKLINLGIVYCDDTPFKKDRKWFVIKEMKNAI